MTAGRRNADVRAALLDATVAEITETGPDRASIRSIGRRVGISHQAITHYFADRTSLLTAVATQGWRQLHEAVDHALTERHGTRPAPEPGEAVATIGRTYVRFARTHRPRFQLMFSSSLLDAEHPDLADAKARMWLLHLHTVETDQRRGWGGDVPAAQLALAAFSLAHGMASLEEHMPGLLPDPRSADDVLDVVTRAVLTVRPAFPAG